MKKYLLFVFIFLGCGTGDSRLIRKEIKLNGGGSIKWYYYSYITNMSPDIVLIEKNGKEKEIYKATFVIADVELRGDSIILKLVNPSNGLIFTKRVERDVFDYKVILDSSGTHDDLNLIPKGVKE